MKTFHGLYREKGYSRSAERKRKYHQRKRLKEGECHRFQCLPSTSTIFFNKRVCGEECEKNNRFMERSAGHPGNLYIALEENDVFWKMNPTKSALHLHGSPVCTDTWSPDLFHHCHTSNLWGICVFFFFLTPSLRYNRYTKKRTWLIYTIKYV